MSRRNIQASDLPSSVVSDTSGHGTADWAVDKAAPINPQWAEYASLVVAGDWGPALTAAMNAGPVYLGAYTYEVATPIISNHGYAMIGEPNRSTIQATAGFPASTTLSGTLSTGSAITSLPATAPAAGYAAGTPLTLVYGSSVQTFTVAAGGAAGNVTSIPVNSLTPTYAFPSGAAVNVSLYTCQNTAGKHIKNVIFDGAGLASMCVDTSWTTPGESPSLGSKYESCVIKNYTNIGWLANDNNDAEFKILSFSIYGGVPGYAAGDYDLLVNAGTGDVWFEELRALGPVGGTWQVLTARGGYMYGLMITGGSNNFLNLNGVQLSNNPVTQDNIDIASGCQIYGGTLHDCWLSGGVNGYFLAGPGALNGLLIVQGGYCHPAGSPAPGFLCTTSSGGALALTTPTGGQSRLEFRGTLIPTTYTPVDPSTPTTLVLDKCSTGAGTWSSTAPGSGGVYQKPPSRGATVAFGNSLNGSEWWIDQQGIANQQTSQYTQRAITRGVFTLGGVTTTKTLSALPSGGTLSILGVDGVTTGPKLITRYGRNGASAGVFDSSPLTIPDSAGQSMVASIPSGNAHAANSTDVTVTYAGATSLAFTWTVTS